MKKIVKPKNTRTLQNDLLRCFILTFLVIKKRLCFGKFNNNTLIMIIIICAQNRTIILQDIVIVFGNEIAIFHILAKHFNK